MIRLCLSISVAFFALAATLPLTTTIEFHWFDGIELIQFIALEASNYKSTIVDYSTSNTEASTTHDIFGQVKRDEVEQERKSITRDWRQRWILSWKSDCRTFIKITTDDTCMLELYESDSIWHIEFTSVNNSLNVNAAAFRRLRSGEGIDSIPENDKMKYFDSKNDRETIEFSRNLANSFQTKIF